MKPEDRKTERPSRVACSALLGCDSVLIVTPATPRYALMEMEMWADTILGWDGTRLDVLKSRSSPRMLSPRALRLVAASLPNASANSVATYCGDPAISHTRQKLPVDSDGSQGRLHQRKRRLGSGSGWPSGNRAVNGSKTSHSRNGTRQPKNQKVVRS